MHNPVATVHGRAQPPICTAFERGPSVIVLVRIGMFWRWGPQVLTDNLRTALHAAGRAAVGLFGIGSGAWTITRRGGHALPVADERSSGQPVLRVMRVLLGAGTVLVFAAGTQLYVLSAHTDRYFAWTIANPLTAATIGAFYYGAVAIAGLSTLARRWDRARVGVPGIAVFLWLTIAASLAHLTVLHLHSRGLAPRTAAIAWLVIYIADPPLFLLAYVLQLRAGGRDPARPAPAPAWHRWACAVLAVPVLVAGVGLFAFPGPGARHWAWPLPSIAAQALAAWLIALALLLCSVAKEGDLLRSRPATTGMVAFAVLQLVALARYPHAAHGAAAIAWIVLLAAVGVLGGYALARLPAALRGSAGDRAPSPSGAR